MSSPSVFISYSRQDYPFVQRFIADLQAEGIQVWIDQQGLQVGTPSWERAIRDAIRATDAVVLIASPDSGQSRYVRGEIRLAGMYKRAIYPIWAAGEMWEDCVPLDLIETQHTDARTDKYQKALLDLLKALRAVQSAHTSNQLLQTAPLDPDFVPRNPYKGLRAFTGNDTGDFFGRDGLIKELVKAVNATPKLGAARFLAIVGPSGSGKSSVVMAGLLPKLQNGALPASKEWVYLDPVLPGAQPLESLTVSLADTLHMANSDVMKDLDDSARGLHLLARRLTKGRHDTRVVLLVDQFEELFTQTMDADKREHFIDLLVTAATEPGGQLFVILTLRADFYDRPMNYAELGKLLEKHTKSVLPMSIEDLRDVIEKPATLPDVRLEFEVGLVGDLLFEVRGQTGALPLLQFTLDQLVEQRQGRKLTNAVYQDMGGVKGALAKHAEAVYQSLPSDQHRELARSLFLRLIEPGATEQDTTRRRAAQSELVTPDAGQTALLREISAAFVNARLLTTNVIAGLAMIEVSHEALIREWGRLTGWLNTAREDVKLQQIISRDTDEWIQWGKQPEDTYGRAKLKLEAAKAWLTRNVPSIEELAFIDAGITLAEEAKEEQESLKILNQIAQVLSTVDIERSLKSAIELVTQALLADHGVIFLLDELSDELITRAQNPPETHLDIAQVVAKLVVSSNTKEIIVQDFRQMEFDTPISNEIPIWGSGLVVLLENNDDPLGVIVIMYHATNACTDTRIRLLRSVASLLAASINNSDLYHLIRDQAERLGALLRSEQEEAQKNSAILESIVDGVMLTDDMGIVRVFNQAAEHILEYPRDQVIGQAVFILMSLFGNLADQWLYAIENWTKNPQNYVPGKHGKEFLNLGKRVISIHLSPVYIDERFLGTVSVFRETTK